MEKELVDMYEIATNQGLNIMAYQKLIKPCECYENKKRIRIGMCIPCSMRERVAGGEGIIEVVGDYE